MRNRARAIGTLGLSAIALAVTAAAQDSAPVAAMEQAGWTLVTASEDTFVYMRPQAVAVDGVRRVWTAYDSDKVHHRDGLTFQSVESLGEFDCPRQLSRVVDELYYEAPGLKGRGRRSPAFKVTPWAAPGKGSVGEVRMTFACGGPPPP
ncbi:MAG: hypothetical protein JNK30_21210 [Phenylobacterium sp.]|uniref:surface-adhesin E family protein n=1 Tax=Phenylobacterium sp. TaxID=1871053 RepID=UPI001A4D7276|nr:surface-adhesin E family protein [Phenylobacterium sp.]MBL8773918.1 hypothetical protein [Phenylobacterium sp.]